MIFRKATDTDIEAICEIYSDIFTEIEAGRLTTGWVRGTYPSESTVRQALDRGDMFVAVDNGRTVGSAIINRIQLDVYENAPWEYREPDSKVMVLHTLAISPRCLSLGYGTAFVDFYEKYALENGCDELRMDTNALNTRARRLYLRLGYTEIDTVHCQFNGISSTDLVLLEKHLK